MEVVNVHDDALVFEPIYRVVFGADTDELIGAVRAHFAAMQPARLTSTMAAITSKGEQSFPCTSFPVGELQELLAAYVAEHPGTVLDYIHGESSLREALRGGRRSRIPLRGDEEERALPRISAKRVFCLVRRSRWERRWISGFTWSAAVSAELKTPGPKSENGLLGNGFSLI